MKKVIKHFTVYLLFGVFFILSSCTENEDIFKSCIIDFEFYEDYPNRLRNVWNFRNAIYTIVDEKLQLKSSNSDKYSISEHEFSKYYSPPWRVECEVSFITSTTNNNLEFGPYVEIRGYTSSNLLFDSMRLSFIKNPTSSFYDGANWIWWWFLVINDSIGGWTPYNDGCYGYSNSIKTNGEVNYLEIICNSDKTFTFNVNGNTITSHNNAIIEFENLASIDIMLDVNSIELWGSHGAANIVTEWDNIVFDTESEEPIEDIDEQSYKILLKDNNGLDEKKRTFYKGNLSKGLLINELLKELVRCQS